MKLYEEFKIYEHLWESTTGDLEDINGDKLEATSYRTFDEYGWPDYSPGFKKISDQMFETVGAPFHDSVDPRSFSATYVVNQKEYEIYFEPCADDDRNRRVAGFVEVWGYELCELGDYTEKTYSWTRDFTRKRQHLAGNLVGGRLIPSEPGPKNYDELLDTLIELGLIKDKSKCL